MHVLRILEKKIIAWQRQTYVFKKCCHPCGTAVYLVFENKNTVNVPVALKGILLLKEEMPVLWVMVIARKSECVCL